MQELLKELKANNIIVVNVAEDEELNKKERSIKAIAFHLQNQDFIFYDPRLLKDEEEQKEALAYCYNAIKSKDYKAYN